MAAPSLILASTSPRRLQLLELLAVPFRVVPADTPELHSEHLSPREGCQLNAYRKGRAVAKQFPDDVVLAADTAVCLGERVFGKPRDYQEAVRMLGELQGCTHHVVTGVCLLHLRKHRQRLFSVGTAVTFRRLTRPQIEQYLKRIDPLDKAGAYAVQEHGQMIIERIEGSFTNVVGLPLQDVEQELKAFRDRLGESAP